MTHQILPFVITVAADPSHLLDACAVRVAGYGRHLPQLRQALAYPDDADRNGDTVVFVAHEKADGRPVGTMRVQVCCAEKSLLIESCVTLPPALRQDARAEITRLAVSPGADPRVKWALWKVGYFMCLARGARHLVIAARTRALVRQYEALGATCLFIDEPMVALSYAANIPHRVLLFDVQAAKKAWFHAKHPLYDFMFVERHLDLAIPFVQQVEPVAIDQARQGVGEAKACAPVTTCAQPAGGGE